MTPVTLLASPSPTLRDDLVRLLAVRLPALGVVRYAVELPGPDGEVALVRELADRAGVIDRRRIDTGNCISCAVRYDALDALEDLQEHAGFDEIVLALPVPVAPAAVAEVLRTPHDTLRLAGVTVVVDALLLLEQLSGDELLAEYGLAAGSTDRRSLAELVIDQLEQADVLAVAQLYRASTGSARTLDVLLAHLNPLAVRMPISPGGVGCEQLVRPGRGWAATDEQRARLVRLARDLVAPDHEVSTVRWSSEQALHPGRLHEALRDILTGVIRSSGQIQLANRNHGVQWASAGSSLSIGSAEHDSGCSELLLTGIGLDAELLTAVLDRCLVDAEEDSEDPFTEALGGAASTATPAAVPVRDR